MTTEEKLDLLKDMQQIRPTSKRAEQIKQIEESLDVAPCAEREAMIERCLGAISAFDRIDLAPLRAEVYASKKPGATLKKALQEAEATNAVMRDILREETDDIEERIKGMAWHGRIVIESMLRRKVAK